MDFTSRFVVVLLATQNKVSLLLVPVADVPASAADVAVKMYRESVQSALMIIVLYLNSSFMSGKL